MGGSNRWILERAEGYMNTEQMFEWVDAVTIREEDAYSMLMAHPTCLRSRRPRRSTRMLGCIWNYCRQNS